MMHPIVRYFFFHSSYLSKADMDAYMILPSITNPCPSVLGQSSGLLSIVFCKVAFNLSQHGLKEKNVIPPPSTPPTTGIAFLKNPAKNLFCHLYAKPFCNTFDDRIDCPFCKRLAQKLLFNTSCKRFCHSFQRIVRTGNSIHDAKTNHQYIHGFRIQYLTFFFQINCRKSI